MLYLPNSKTMVLHIPKCGGCWVASAIQRATDITWMPYRRTHDNLAAMDHPDVNYVIVFVRHPVEWYRSYWRYRIQQNPPGAWTPDRGHPTEALDACSDPDFETFVENCLARFPGYVTAMYEDFTGGGKQFDVLWGRQENLAMNAAVSLHAVGERFDMRAMQHHPRQNTSKGPEVTWPKKLWQRVADAEATAMERYGYE